MFRPTLLEIFVQTSIEKGISFEKIQSTLLKAGWGKDHIQKELGQYQEIDFPLAVPKPFYSGSFILLSLMYFFGIFISFFSICYSIFDIINLYIPSDNFSRYTFFYNNYSESFAWTTASLIVFIPVLFFIHKYLRTHYLTFLSGNTFYTKLILSIFLAGSVLISLNIVWILYDFLLGSLTSRFMLKSLTIFIFSFGFYFYYKPEKRS